MKVGEPPRPGFLHPTANGRVVQFFGNQFHGTEEYTKGPRHVAIAYIPRGWKTLTAEHMHTLETLGFRIPEMSTPSPETKLLTQACTSQYPIADTITQESAHSHNPILNNPKNSDTPRSEEGKEERVLDSEGHREFWEDVCGVNGDYRVLGNGDVYKGMDSEFQGYGILAEQAMACLADIVDIVSLDPEDRNLEAALESVVESPEEAVARKQPPGHPAEDYGARGTLKPHRRLKADDFAAGV